MRVVLVYVYPVVHGDGDRHLQYAWRFLQSYHANPPDWPHETIVVCNGGQPDDTFHLFSTLPNFRVFIHDDSGYDIGAYQAVSKQSNADLMVFCGGSTYCRGKGWLKRMVESFVRHGPALYGCTANQGVTNLGVYPHIRTTGFWMPPALFNQYPMKVTEPQQRYPFEHGKDCLTSWIKARRMRAYMVTWWGEYEWPNWDAVPNGFHREKQEGLLLGDRLTCPPFFPYP